MSAIGTIDGKTILGSSVAGWPLQEGTSPVVVNFDVMPGDADALLHESASPIVLELDAMTVRRLYVIGEVPGPNLHIRTVQVADRRYWWQYVLILRRFNVRRRVGFKRLSSEALPKELQPVVEDIWYAPWSTKDRDGKRPWLAREALDDVLDRVLERECETYHGAKDFKVDELSFAGLTEIDIEGLEVDMTGAEGINHVLRALPQAAITADPNGWIRVYSRVDGSEILEVQKSGAEAVGGGHIEYIRHHRTRPKSVKVYFSREVELRFDFEEVAVAGDSPTVAERDDSSKDDRFLDNVLPVPDFELDVGGRKIPQGTWLPLAVALAAWNKDGGIPDWGKIDIPWIRRAMVPFWDFWASPRIHGESDQNAEWVGRLSAIEQHFRQSFRINSRWMDRIHSLRAYRVGIVDSETGSRAPASAYADYARVGGMRSALGADHDFIKNIQGYPASGNIDSSTKIAPARVSVADSDQGILHLDYVADVFRLYGVTLPSRVFNAQSRKAGPTQRLRDADYEPIGFDILPSIRKGNFPELSASHKLAVIVTALAGAPNDLRQLHMIEVSPDEITHLLPGSCEPGLKQAVGPSMDVRIGATPETTAMVRWDDAWAERIEQAFGLSGTPDEPVDLTPITINAGEDHSPLDVIARAVAAGVYASFSDRYQGSKTVQMRSDIRLGGWLGQVTFAIGTDGEVTTKLVLREGGPTLDLMTLLPSSLRKLMLRIAQP